MKINLNQTVVVKLTKCGRNLFNLYYSELGLDPEDYEWYAKQKDGWHFPIWQLMNIFGKQMYMGSDSPFKNMNVELIEE